MKGTTPDSLKRALTVLVSQDKTKPLVETKGLTNDCLLDEDEKIRVNY